MSVLNQQRLVRAVQVLNVGTSILPMEAACRSHTVDVKATTTDLTRWKNVNLAA